MSWRSNVVAQSDVEADMQRGSAKWSRAFRRGGDINGSRRDDEGSGASGATEHPEPGKSTRRRSVLRSLVAVSVAGLALYFGVPVISAEVDIRRAHDALDRKEYAAAVSLLTGVLRDSPGHLRARTALAEAYARQFVPGGETPENLRLARQAREQFLALVERDPARATAIAGLARMELAAANLDEAATWAERLTAVAPDEAEGHHTLALIAWRKFSPLLMAARRDSGMTLEEAGPIADVSVRDGLRAEWLGELDGAVASASRAVAIDAQRADTLVLLSSLARARADLASSASDYDAQMRLATESAQKAAAARLAAAAPPSAEQAAPRQE